MYILGSFEPKGQDRCEFEDNILNKATLTDERNSRLSNLVGQTILTSNKKYMIDDKLQG
jgi:hypothetical protein